MQDCNLSVGGVTQVKTDRQNFFPQAPFSPAIFNVPIKPNATSDIDNFRNDLLKQYCKNVGSQGGRFDTPFDTMKKYGQKKKGGAGSYGISDIDNAINEVTKDTTDAVGQVKYLLCQQADGLIAPPKPPIVQDGTSAGQLWEQVYGANLYTKWTAVVFLILSLALIVKYIIRLNNFLSSKWFWSFLIGSILSSVIWVIILGVPYCYDKPNDYYDAQTYGSFGYILIVYGIVLAFSLGLIVFGRLLKKEYLLMFGLLIQLSVLFSADIWMAIFNPQVFIILVIVWRIISYNVWDDSSWAMPFVSLYGRVSAFIIKKYFPRAVYDNELIEKIYSIANDELFKAFV